MSVFSPLELLESFVARFRSVKCILTSDEHTAQVRSPYDRIKYSTNVRPACPGRHCDAQLLKVTQNSAILIAWFYILASTRLCKIACASCPDQMVHSQTMLNSSACLLVFRPIQQHHLGHVNAPDQCLASSYRNCGCPITFMANEAVTRPNSASLQTKKASLHVGSIAADVSQHQASMSCTTSA